MTDAQIAPIAVSIAITLFAIAAGSIFNNVRISDSTTALNKRIDDSIRLMEQRFNSVDNKLDRIADTITAILGDHEQRIRVVEQRPR